MGEGTHKARHRVHGLRAAQAVVRGQPPHGDPSSCPNERRFADTLEVTSVDASLSVPLRHTGTCVTETTTELGASVK